MFFWLMNEVPHGNNVIQVNKVTLATRFQQKAAYAND